MSRLGWRLVLGALGLASIGLLTVQRPVTGLTALLLSCALAYRRRTTVATHPLRFMALVGPAGIGAVIGGVVGEGLSYLLVGVPTGAATSPLWLVMGALGVGASYSLFIAFGIALLGLASSWNVIVKRAA